MMISRLMNAFWFSAGAVHITTNADGSMTRSVSTGQWPKHFSAPNGKQKRFKSCGDIDLDKDWKMKACVQLGCTLLGDSCADSCPCGEKCTTKGEPSGYCQADGKSCTQDFNSPEQCKDKFNCMSKELWTPEKKEWCCKEKQIGCPPVEFNCKSRELWTAEKKEWCCKVKHIGCPPVEFNCKTRELWTPEKKEWCCKEKQIGCQTKCGPVCAIYCPHGNVEDENGCPTCQCKNPPAAGDSCDPQTFQGQPTILPLKNDCGVAPACAAPPLGCNYNLEYKVSPSGAFCCLTSCGQLEPGCGNLQPIGVAPAVGDAAEQ